MEKYYQLKNTNTTQTNTGALPATRGIENKYKGVLHPDSLLWCHGRYGLEHNKIRKFIYPFYKYSQTEDASIYRVITCVCTNCNMTFYGELSLGASLSIPVYKLDSYSPYEVIVRVNGTAQSIKGELVFPFRKASQEEINDSTRQFIEMVR